MGRSLKQYVAISGSTGFVGKNLLKFLTQKKLKYIPVLRSDFKKGKLPLLSKCFCFVHSVAWKRIESYKIRLRKYLLNYKI